MRRVLLTTVALLAFAATAAVAADLPRAMPAKAPAYVPVGYNWTGFYSASTAATPGAARTGAASPVMPIRQGGMVGGTAGYNWQAPGSPWVFGLEGDLDWTNIKGTFVNAACPTGCQTKNNWLGTVRGRVGYAWDRVMPYVTGGLAVGDIKANQLGFAGVNDTNVGWQPAPVSKPRWPATGARSSNISTSILAHQLRPVIVLAADAGRISCRRGARRRELPVLTATLFEAKAPDEFVRGLLRVWNLRTIFVQSSLTILMVKIQ